MGRAIIATSLVVIAAIGGVLLHLSLRGPARRPVARRPAPMLINEPDGSVFDLALKLETLEGRLRGEEQRSKQQAGENNNLRRENERLGRELRVVQQELARLRRQLPRKPEPDGPPVNGPDTSPGPPPGPEPGPPP